MRTAGARSSVIVAFSVACASTPTAGPLGEGTALQPRITAVDTARPPKSAFVELDRPGYVALLLVAPGHSATLLYPRDSLTSNQLSAGAHKLTFEIPELLVQNDSVRLARARQRLDSMTRAGPRPRTRSTSTAPLPTTTPTYLLLVTSPQQLSYRRIIEKTAGVSIPTIEIEALNAVAKAIKSTIPAEPRDWAGYYQRAEVRRP